MSRLSDSDRARILKPIDSAWTVLAVEPVVTRTLPLLRDRHWITPNGLTVLAVVLGTGAAAAFGLGALLIAALLFELRFVLDCLDGNLARLRSRPSRLGGALDSVSDQLVVLACFIAMAMWLDAPWLAVALAASYPLSFSLQTKRDEFYAELGWNRPVETLGSHGPGGWLARHRIYPIITSIDVEHLALFVAPLLHALGVNVLFGTLVGAAVYFSLQATRFLVSSLRAGHALDRRSAAP